VALGYKKSDPWVGFIIVKSSEQDELGDNEDDLGEQCDAQDKGGDKGNLLLSKPSKSAALDLPTMVVSPAQDKGGDGSLQDCGLKTCVVLLSDTFDF